MEDLMNQKIITSTIVKIEWERIHLHIFVKVDFAKGADTKAPLNFYFVNGNYLAKAKAQVLGVEDNVYHLKLNITNTGDKACIAQGTYNLVLCQNEKMMAKAVIDPSIVKLMSDYSRNFLYNARNKVFTVTFYVAEDEEELIFVMYVLASAKTGIGFPGRKKKAGLGLNPIKHLRHYYAKHNRKWKVKIYNMYQRRYSNTKNVVLFFSEQNEVISTNLQAVRDRMIARGMDKNGYTILESYRSSMTNQHLGTKSWLDVLKKLAMANIIIVDDHVPLMDWLHVRDDKRIIQLWHAGAGFKSSGYSRWGHLGCPAPQSAHRQYSYGIAGSKAIAPFFSEVWGINDANVLPTGMPRIDEYLDKDYREKTTKDIYNEYPMCKGKKVILFAPTYRGRNKGNAHYPYELIDFNKLYKLCGDEYVVLFKMHPWVAAGVPIEEKYKDKFVDVGRYPNINDLFYITDLLITDYSSNIFEYSLMRKPMLFFAFDEIQYSFSRGFHRDYRSSAPGKVVTNFEDLLTAIANKDFEYEKVDEYVEKHFDYIDSNASDRVIDWLVLGNIPENIQKEIEENDAIQEELARLDFTPKDAQNE